MKQRSRLRKESELSEPVNRQLDMYAAAAKAARLSASLTEPTGPGMLAYALAAGAAGIGALASVPSAQAKIVYYQTHTSLIQRYTFQLDVNRDGQDDFGFPTTTDFCTSESCFFPLGAGRDQIGNSIITAKVRDSQCFSGFSDDTIPLKAGAQIGPLRHWGFGGAIACVASNSKGIFWYGRWANGGKGVKNRYLGLKFQIKGKTHYGWARITVKPTDTGFHFTATLTGYAYETIPGKPIIAGKTKGSDVVTVPPSSAAQRQTRPRPATLGELAVGR